MARGDCLSSEKSRASLFREGGSGKLQFSSWADGLKPSPAFPPSSHRAQAGVSEWRATLAHRSPCQHVLRDRHWHCFSQRQLALRQEKVLRSVSLAWVADSDDPSRAEGPILPGEISRSASHGRGAPEGPAGRFPTTGFWTKRLDRPPFRTERKLPSGTAEVRLLLNAVNDNGITALGTRVRVASILRWGGAARKCRSAARAVYIRTQGQW